ncbi:MAG TPA: xanthine dehydrogenase family protein molybdopterin-binding subunit, partial [Actinomycetes bacterium]|nr:xanthine dehydrogenase family protein molybdopterin-binding subunit [Actinomycetes bacterium]
MAAAAGRPEALDRALAALDGTFVRLTGTGPRRRPGETYGGRTLVHEDARRDLKLLAGPGLLEAFGPALTLLLQGARWLTAEAAGVCRAALGEVHAQLAAEAGVAPVELASLLPWAARLLLGEGRKPLDRLLEDFAARWAALLGLHAGRRRVRLRSDALRPRVLAAFPAARPGWAQARYATPDLQLAAADAAAVGRGDFEVVLGELHVATVGIDGTALLGQHPRPERLRQQVLADLPEPRVWLVHPRSWPGLSARQVDVLAREGTVQLAYADTWSGRPDLELPVAALLVEEAGGRLWARTRDGRRRFDLVEVVAGLLAVAVADAYKLFGAGRPHTPRVTVDRLVVQRESWRAAASAGFAFRRDEAARWLAARWLAARAWARSLGLPRFAFASPPTEPKPLFVDFASPRPWRSWPPRCATRPAPPPRPRCRCRRCCRPPSRRGCPTRTAGATPASCAWSPSTRRGRRRDARPRPAEACQAADGSPGTLPRMSPEEGGDGRVLGRPLRRLEDERLLVGAGRYVADLDLGGAAHVTYARSSEAHARVAVDTGAAAAAPGVLAVVTAADLDLAPIPPAMPAFNQAMVRPWLADRVVRFVGEPLAAVVSETREQGVDAAELVAVDYDWLEPVAGVETADEGTVLLFPEAGSNVAFRAEEPRPDPALFDGCEVVVRQRQVVQRLAPCPLEGRAAAAAWGEDGRLTFWVSTQAPHRVRDALARALGVPPARVRVRCPEVGGAFGSKGSPYPEELLLAWLARRVGRPLRWVETRSESMLGLTHGRAQVQQVALGGRRDGTLLAYRLQVLQDCGAYPRFAAFLPSRARQLASGAYAIPRVEAGGRSLVTTTVPVGPYRGAGRPEATMAIERAVDLFAAEVGMDPAELRRRNLVAGDAFPWTTATGTVYDSGDYRRALELALEVGGYAGARAEQASRRAAGGPRQLGVGLSSYVEVSGGGPGGEYGAVEVTPAGGGLVRTGSSASGQGHRTTWAMLASEQLGIPVERIEVVAGDTDRVARGTGTMGSRSAQTGGLAVHRAATALV